MITERRLQSLTHSEFLHGFGGDGSWAAWVAGTALGEADEAKSKDTNSFPSKEEAAVTRQEGLVNV